MTLASLFDGSGGFPLAAEICGIKPIWASEIEPFPVRVTTKRFSDMIHYGNVSTINGADVPPVDIITFGSPCQDMSVAGKRAGLDGERSNLFHEAIRIIREMRAATNGEQPRYAVWENVPGAFSSNKGEDFRAVLEAFFQTKDETVTIPKPEKWGNAGAIVADGYSVAWKVSDAQYWGVPQRRRRIFLVADFGSECAGELLFEQQGLSGDIAQSESQRQGTAGSAEDSIGTAECRLYEPKSALDENWSESGVKNSLRANASKSSHAIVIENHHIECPIVYGICSDKSNSMLSSNPHSGIYEAQTSRTLDGNGGNPACHQGGMAVVSIQDNNSATLGCVNDQTLFVPSSFAGYTEQNPILRASGGDLGGGSEGLVVDKVAYSMGNGQLNQMAMDDKANALNCMHDQQAVLMGNKQNYVVRRLTPLETCRLQGFPDYWTDNLETANPTEEDISYWAGVFETYSDVMGTKVKSRNQIIKWLKNPKTDSAEYKMWGNGVALPCVVQVLKGIERSRK